jgi:ribosomal protein L37E
MGSDVQGQCTACGWEFRLLSGYGGTGGGRMYVRCPPHRGLVEVALPDPQARDDADLDLEPAVRVVEADGFEMEEYACPRCGAWHLAWDEVECPECGAADSIEITGLSEWD